MTGFQIFYIAIDCIIEHSTGTSVDKKLFLAPNAASASVAADYLSLSQHHFQYLKIMNLPWGP